ncbi:MAG: protein-glutamate O-methyltransferase CheR [Polyangiaceae bacterium]
MPDSAATPAEIRELATYLSRASGIELDEKKGYLFDARLHTIMAEHACRSLMSLLDKARRDTTGKLRDELVDAVSTNETYFFREPRQFLALVHKLIPDHFEKVDPQRCRIWCAAASTGQEVYSVAIALKEMLGSLNKYRIQIVGTDISGAALDRASKGAYSKLEISRGLSPERVQRFFVPRGAEWVISDELRSLATFQRLNLLEPAASLGTFDIVLCRNVAIYFSAANRAKLFKNLAARLRKGGVLVVSMTENLGTRPEPFVRKEFRDVTYYELP